MFWKKLIISVRFRSLKISQEMRLSGAKKTATLQFCQKMILWELLEQLRNANTMKRFNSYRVYPISIKSPKTQSERSVFNSRICPLSRVRLYTRRVRQQITFTLSKKVFMKSQGPWHIMRISVKRLRKYSPIPCVHKKSPVLKRWALLSTRNTFRYM